MTNNVELSIAERRTISEALQADAALAQEFQQDPHAVVERIVGKSLAPDMRVELVEERPGTVAIILPRFRALTDGIPAAADMRGSIENDLLSLLTVDPSTRERFAADPRGFLVSECSIDIGDLQVDAKLEDDGVTYIALPAAPTEELSDEMLDLVSGGDKAGSTCPSTAKA